MRIYFAIGTWVLSFRRRRINYQVPFLTCEAAAYWAGKNGIIGSISEVKKWNQ